MLKDIEPRTSQTFSELEPPLDVVNLPSVKVFLIDRLQAYRDTRGYRQVAYVAGIIGSKGQEFEDFNRAELKRIAEEYRKADETVFTFTSPDVFTKGLFARLEESRLERNERRLLLIEFWRGVLGSGQVNNLILTPGWRESMGATDEYNVAVNLGISIHDIEQSVDPASRIIIP
jgi:hypothetical protein